MDCLIARELRLKPRPLAMLFTDEKPRGALEFDESRWTCIISLMDAATAGRTVVISPDAHICMLTGCGHCQSASDACKMPPSDISDKFIVLKPLQSINDNEQPPEVVTMLVSVDQLAVLVQLANHERAGSNAVIIPCALGCQSAFLLPYFEAKQDTPHAVVGRTDPFTRRYTPDGMLSFSVPWKMFLEMEGHVQAGALEVISPVEH